MLNKATAALELTRVMIRSMRSSGENPAIALSLLIIRWRRLKIGLTEWREHE